MQSTSKKPILKSFLRIFEDEKSICEAVIVDRSNAVFQLQGKNVINEEVDTPKDHIRAVGFIDLIVSPLECDKTLSMFDEAWALVYTQRLDKLKFPNSAKKPFNKSTLDGFAISHCQIVYVETYQILMLHQEMMKYLFAHHQTMQGAIIDLLNHPQSPLLRNDMNRRQIVQSTAIVLSSALRTP